MEKSSEEMNPFLSRVYISPEHAASFTGLDKLYHMVKNQFPSLTRKGIRKWTESKEIFPIHYTNHLEEPSNETRCMLLKLNVSTPENRPHHSSIELQTIQEEAHHSLKLSIKVKFFI